MKNDQKKSSNRHFSEKRKEKKNYSNFGVGKNTKINEKIT